jgi:hypothetical protein
MRELYVEGVAIHDDPEPCVGAREGGGEASVGAHVGRVIEPRKNLGSGCRRFQIGGRQHRRQRYRELPAGPARSKKACMRGISMRREPGGPAVARRVGRRAGCSGKVEAVRLR